MKKMILGAALLLVLGTIQAAPHQFRGGEHNILSSDLPAALQSAIKTNYTGYWITDLKQDGEGKHTRYLLTIEDADQVLHLQADRNGSWDLVSTEVKTN